MRGYAAPVFQNIPRHPDADYRLAPVIVLFGRLVVMFVDVISSGSASARVLVYVYMALLLFGGMSHSASAVVLSLYAKVLPLIYLLGISRLLFFSALGENVGPWYAKVRAGASLSSSHFALERRCSAKEEKRSAVLQEPPVASLQGRLEFIRLLEVGSAAIEEP